MPLLFACFWQTAASILSLLAPVQRNSEFLVTNVEKYIIRYTKLFFGSTGNRTSYANANHVFIDFRLGAKTFFHPSR